jgi:hypothetical protein
MVCSGLRPKVDDRAIVSLLRCSGPCERWYITKRFEYTIPVLKCIAVYKSAFDLFAVGS